MLDHVGFNVSDYEQSRAFYELALAPLGLALLMEPAPGIGGFGEGQKPFFWIATRGPAPRARSTSRSRSSVARRSTRSTPPRSRRARPTTARPVCARSTTRTTTAPTCWTPTATTSRRSATPRRSDVDAPGYAASRNAACAADTRAIGTRYGEQET
jgi:hypothetical protein